LAKVLGGVEKDNAAKSPPGRLGHCRSSGLPPNEPERPASIEPVYLTLDRDTAGGSGQRAIAFFRASNPAPVARHSENAAATEGVAASQIDAEVEVGGGISSIARNELSQQEVERRRGLVRAFFNDFWSGTHDKPAAFAERLDQAEGYLNERLTANGEGWRLDAKTRIMLGLPPRLS
jgi:hypothetical protein